MQPFKHKLRNRIFSCFLIGAMLIPSLEPVTVLADNGSQRSPAISISSREDLEKIGKDAGYPMDGDYQLTADIDLSGKDWEPLTTDGNYVGNDERTVVPENRRRM